MHLRNPTIDDAPAIHQLVRDSPPLDLHARYAYLLLCHHFADTCLVAEEDHRLVAAVTAYRPPKQQDTLFIWQVMVAASHRGKRLASQLLMHLIRQDTCRDIAFVEATVTPSNTASRKLFGRIASETGSSIHWTPLFTSEHLSDADQAHEAEDCVRIGPIRHAPATAPQSQLSNAAKDA